MRYALLGALLMVGGIAARIEAARHQPGTTGGGTAANPFSGGPSISYGWPATTYDLVRIGGWALLIFGAVIVLFTLVRELKRT